MLKFADNTTLIRLISDGDGNFRLEIGHLLQPYPHQSPCRTSQWTLESPTSSWAPWLHRTSNTKQASAPSSPKFRIKHIYVAAEEILHGSDKNGAVLFCYYWIHPHILHCHLVRSSHCRGQMQTATYHTLCWEGDWVQSATPAWPGHTSDSKACMIIADPSHPANTLFVPLATSPLSQNPD